MEKLSTAFAMLIAASNAPGYQSRPSRLGSLAPFGLRAASDQRATEEGERILREEDHLFGRTVSQDAGVGAVGELLISEPIRRRDMDLSLHHPPLV